MVRDLQSALPKLDSQYMYVPGATPYATVHEETSSIFPNVNSTLPFATTLAQNGHTAFGAVLSQTGKPVVLPANVGPSPYANTDGATAAKRKRIINPRNRTF